MNFVFWQNMVSIHQSALMKALSCQHAVTLVVERVFEQERLNSGWIVPDMGNTKIIVSPTNSEIDCLLSLDDKCIHIFTGMRAYPMVTKAFKQAIRNKLCVALYMEPYDPIGWKGLARRVVYYLLTLRYKKHVSFVLATGDTGVKCYRKSGFSAQNVFEWGYFTEDKIVKSVGVAQNLKVQLLYVGRLDGNKQILTLMDSFNHFCSDVAELTIIGTGPFQQQVEERVRRNSNLHYMGILPNNRVRDIMSSSDLVILPSLYDGWGAVVNEALQVGCRVLCSSACGAATLLDNNERGGTFDWNKAGDFNDKLVYWCKRGKLDNETRWKIINWARQNISGFAAVEYLEEIVHFCTSKHKLQIPSAPWKNN